MSYCNNESDHRRQAERDFSRGRKDRDCYDRHTFDGCKEAYTREYDRLARQEERRQEERREDEDRNRRQAEADAQDRRRQAWIEEERRLDEQRLEDEQQAD